MNVLEMNTLRYFINLDERGEFYADVRDDSNNTIFEIKGFDVFEDGWMRNKRDLKGLKNYLVDLGV
uniref:Uncharacterized protein n=1 Tax=mine drainage metagenome TaxID=410659 RepID=E6QW74_9ZZZZ